MARVVLHIGTHKTGSTAVQHALAENRWLLARRGVAYPDIPGSSVAHHGLMSLWNPYLANFAPRGGAEAAWRTLARRHARAPGVLVLSSEEFSRAHGDYAIDYAWVREALSEFESVDVVCLLRDQLSFVQSVYLELCKNRAAAGNETVRIPPWSGFFSKVLKQGTASDLALDYNRLHDRLLESFEPERIHLIPYARAAQGPGGVVGAVLARIDRGLDPAGLARFRDGRVNVTGDPLSVWAAARISAPFRPPDRFVALVRGLVAERFGERTTLYSGREIEAVRKSFGPANQRLAERLAERDPDFALPWADLAGVAGRDRIDEAFWIEVARRLHASRREVAR